MDTEPVSSPQVLKAAWRQFGVTHGRLDRAMAQVCLQRPGVGALVRQCVARGMAQHVRMHLKGHLGLDSRPLDHLLQAGHGEGRSPLADEDEGRPGIPIRTVCQRRHRGGDRWLFMSALPPRKPTCAVQLGMSAKCQQRPTHSSKQRLYSITSSARASNAGGTLSPRALAVLRLMAISNLVGCVTGKSAGFSPLRIRPT